MEQYFTNKPTTENELYKFDWNIGAERFYFYTSNSVFSKNGVDFGSMLLIETVVKENKGFEGSILDMGCGYGPIGVCIARLLDKSFVTMADINERALELAKMNARENKVENRIKVVNSSAYEKLEGSYNMIVTNPPIRAGKDIVFSFYEGAYEHLSPGGVLYVVIQKKQGAPSSKQKITDIFGSYETADKKSGYFIFRAVK